MHKEQENNNMSEFLDKIKEKLDSGDIDGTDDDENLPSRPPLEEAIDHAIRSLDEIAIYGSYGRASECSREAADALVVIKALKEKYEEQQKIMDILSDNVRLVEVGVDA